MMAVRSSARLMGAIVSGSPRLGAATRTNSANCWSARRIMVSLESRPPWPRPRPTPAVSRIALADPHPIRCPGMRPPAFRYYKRFQMEVDLRRWRRPSVAVRPGYRFVSWSPDLLFEHAEVKYLS